MATIFDAAAKGQRKAMSALYEANKQKVYYVSLLLTGKKGEAVEATNFAFKNVWSGINAHNIKTDDEFTHLAVRKAADYIKRKISKKDNKAFRIPPKRNFLVNPEGKVNKEYPIATIEVLRHLPDLHRFILVLHSVGEYLPEQIASTFKFDMKTVGMALDAENINIHRILSYIKESDIEYTYFIDKLKDGEEEIDFPEEVDNYAYTVIDNIASPIERKKKSFIIKLCSGILAAIIVIGGIVLISLNSNNVTTTSNTGSSSDTVSDSADSSVITEPVIDLDETATYYADIEIENQGTVTVKLDQAAAPVTVSNFVNLAQNDFYDGLTFHRIMEDFMMQGGDPNGDGTGGNTDEDGNEINIVGEFTDNGYENSLSHTRGAISMARASEYNSASSQFFIVHEDSSSSLDGQYAVFGYVSEGMDIVDTICESAEPTDDNGTIEASAQPVIKSITIRTEAAESEES